MDDLVNDIRPRWIAAARGEDWTDDALAIHSHVGQDRLSFLVLGDPGEQDGSQYAVMPPLLAVGQDTDFMVICSDVAYDRGDLRASECERLEALPGWEWTLQGALLAGDAAGLERRTD